MDKKIIVGAGLAGLITACKIKDADIHEAGKPVEQHKAVLRFRDESVSHLTGIPFRPVTVHKAVNLYGTCYDRCTMQMANMYARKVTGKITADRSIWNLDTVKRYVAPEDFYQKLVKRHGSRIWWQNPIGYIQRCNEEQIISTAPLPLMMELCGLKPIEAAFESSSIEVLRYRLPEGTDVFQTVYFVDPAVRTFRASITGDLLIVERIKRPAIDCLYKAEAHELDHVLSSFGMAFLDVTEIERVDQKYGKIIDIPRAQREAILHELTRDFNVFSIGRFATWRNILLDDVVKDIDIVERLLAASSYGRELVLANR